MKKAKRFLTGLLSAALALSLCAMPAMAAEGGETPTTTPTTTESVINPKQTGSITIYKYLQTENVPGKEGTGEEQNVTTDDVTSELPGAGFTVYQVMSAEDLVKYYNGESKDAQPKVEDYFKKNEDGKTVKSYTEKDLDESKVTKIGEEQFTNSTGKVTFKPLPVGLYLVIETTPPESVVSAVTPFLVSIPMTRVKTESEEEGQLKEWLYDVTVYPKNSTKTGNISLIKKGVTGNDKENGVALSGVQFQLQWYNDASNAADKWEDVGGPTGTEDGKIEFKGLKKGTYRVKEIGYTNDAKNKSYVINKDATFEFKVDETGTIQSVKEPTGNEDFVISPAKNTITVYNYKPDIDKQVQDRGTDNWVEASDYSVGDEVPYKITVTVPKNIEKMQTFKVTDTPTNLKYVDGSMRVIADPVENGKKIELTEANKDYTLDTATPKNGFTVSFDTSKLTNYVGKTIEISYKAKLLQTAVTTETGNDNKARLIYSNTTDKDGGGKNTITDSAFVYTFKIEVIKQDENGKKLDGVEFDLYREVDGTPGKNGTLSSEDAKTLGLEEADGKAWLKVNKEKLVTDGNGNIDLSKRLTDAAFKNKDFTNAGLSNGRYALVETKTKENYNLLKGPIYVTLNVQYTKTWTSVTETVDGDGNITKDKSTQTFHNDKGENLTGTRKQVIINRKGFKLPTTGGFGTLLFSGIGVLLVVAGVGVLLSLKKKNRT